VKIMNESHIYLDHGASTPVHPQVLEAMLPFWTAAYGNPSSTHEFGRSASRGVGNARRTVAELMNAKPDEIVFTGGGSESDNLALRGVMWAARANKQGNHLVTSCIEHPAVLETARQLHDYFGFDLTVLPVDEYGQVKVTELEAAIRPDTALISIMTANNEIGSMQPVGEIGQVARAHQIPFHTDAIQAAAVMSWDVTTLPVDLISIAPHKLYGPKGIGILYVREGIELVPALTGGSHENGRRAGTVNVPYVVGAAEAFRLAMADLAERNAHYRRLRDRLIEGILAAVPEDCMLTGHPTERLPHNASFAFRHLSGNDLLIHLDMAGIAVSSGSACKTGDPKPSAVLQALRLGEEWTKGGLRLTVGLQNTMEEIEYILDTVPGVVQKLRELDQTFA
jgi:cysteine desulfurase